MTIHSIIFYLLSSVVIVSTGIAVTRRDLVHAVVYLIFTFFGTAMIFYLLGAPLLAALEVIIYAGAIMVLFLFIIMMIRTEPSTAPLIPPGQWWPVIGFCLLYITAGFLFMYQEPDFWVFLTPAMATPGAFGRFLFQTHWLSIEIISLLLLIAVIGALVLGKPAGKKPNKTNGNRI
ncbi:MAG: NADH-ubiquinone/plastoquinone oxidoreductase subunit 6 [Desulfobacteraceae bacterium]|nr:NADH-ubiquinone/plastoquinone oxidoreductase subunit 6 [Desulfobacteraceae bacterium]